MTDINDDTSYDARYGMHYDFISPLEDDIFFSLVPERNIPDTYSPIIDEENGFCIGYLNNGLSDLYDVYDYNGQYVMRMELPLEHPWLDPLDFIFAGALIYRAVRFGSFSFKAISQRGFFVEFESLIGDGIMNILHGRIKAGLSPEALKFTPKAAQHMKEPARYVPVYIQEKALRYGRRVPDLLRRSDLKTIRYEIAIRRSRYNKNLGSYENKDYTLEVIVDERTWTITHFAYKPLR